MNAARPSARRLMAEGVAFLSLAAGAQGSHPVEWQLPQLPPPLLITGSDFSMVVRSFQKSTARLRVPTLL
ncbi:MAG TPA: hypothetical protein VGF59_04915 [Bryobacteraceae bacterium]|jgi:hypothetical protein